VNNCQQFFTLIQALLSPSGVYPSLCALVVIDYQFLLLLLSSWYGFLQGTAYEVTCQTNKQKIGRLCLRTAAVSSASVSSGTICCCLFSSDNKAAGWNVSVFQDQIMQIFCSYLDLLNLFLANRNCRDCWYVMHWLYHTPTVLTFLKSVFEKLVNILLK